MATQDAEERSSGWSWSRSGWESGGSGWYNYARCKAAELMLELELVLVQVQVVGRSRQALSWPCGSRSRECARGRREWRRSSWSAQEGTQDAGSAAADGMGQVWQARFPVLCCAVLCGCRGQPGGCRGGIQALQGEADGQTGRRQTGSEQDPEPERGWIEEQQECKNTPPRSHQIKSNQIESNQLGRPPHTPQPQRFTLLASHFAQQQ